jgi:sporulation protein YlmC with PRC-barrel domain
MAHCGSFGIQSVPDNLREIRGATVRGSDGEKLGNLDDVIFDHETMRILYLVVDTGDETFLLPADRVSADERNDEGLTAATTREQIKDSPQYRQQSLQTGGGGKDYEQAFKDYWDEQPVLHIKGSDRIITPPEEPASPQADSSGPRARSSQDRQISAADLFPERITDVFSDPAPNPGKVTLRPKSAARAEDAASGTTLLKPRWWEPLEDHLRQNKQHIQAGCPHCTSKAA